MVAGLAVCGSGLCVFRVEEVTALAVRVSSVRAAAVFSAAAAVYALVSREHRVRMELARERASHRLVEGCLVRDLEVFRVRLEAAVAAQARQGSAGLPAGREYSGSLEGGPR